MSNKIKTPEVLNHEMMGSDGTHMGILRTNLDPDTIQKEWSKYYNDDSLEEWGVGIFADLMTEKHKGTVYTFERVFLEEAIYP